MTQRNVLHVIAGMNNGGSETFLMNVYRNSDRDKYKFVFLCFSDEAYDYEDEVIALGGEIVRVNNPARHPLRFAVQLRKIVRDYNLQVVHSHIMHGSALPLLLAKIYNVPIRIAHSHTVTVERASLLKRAYFHVARLLLRRVSTVKIACSTDAGVSLFGVSAEYEVVNNGIELGKFQYRSNFRAAVRTEFSITDKTTVLLHVGRFDYAKNHEFLIRVFLVLQKEHENSLLILVGGGKEEGNIKALVKEVGLSDKVIFAGKRSDVHKFYSAADLFVFPSIFEGLGNVLIESQASGLYSVASSRVPHQAKVTEYFQFMDLDAGPGNWATRLSSILKTKKLNRSNIITPELAAYDVTNTVRVLDKFYEK